MAYYPAQETKIVYGKTKEEIEANIQAAMAEGFFPVANEAVWNGKLPEQGVAYRQAMVKYQNTDPQFIADMYAAFQPILNDIHGTLVAIEASLDVANRHLAAIETNTSRIA